ncbi:MAG: acyl carrier protein [Lachnospirales bacterium]
MVYDKIVEIVTEQLSVDVEEITAETTFEEDLGADSLDLFEIISELEEEYDIEFSADDTEKIKTVGDAVKFIEEATAE